MIFYLLKTMIHQQTDYFWRGRLFWFLNFLEFSAIVQKLPMVEQKDACGEVVMDGHSHGSSKTANTQREQKER
jgi:hypothetical protein